MPNDTILYLIRHGATSANEGGVLQGRGVDHPLSELGQQQAARTAGVLAETPLVAVYSSMLQRAQQTSQAIAMPHGLSPQTIEELAEVHVGRWEGLTWEAIEGEDADAYRRFQDSDGEVGYPDGETFTQVYERVSGALDKLFQQHAGEAFAVVAHSVVNRCYLASLLGRDPHRGRDILQKNCGVNVIRQRGGKLRVVTLNSALHLAS